MLELLYYQCCRCFAQLLWLIGQAGQERVGWNGACGLRGRVASSKRRHLSFALPDYSINHQTIVAQPDQSHHPFLRLHRSRSSSLLTSSPVISHSKIIEFSPWTTKQATHPFITRQHSKGILGLINQRVTPDLFLGIPFVTTKAYLPHPIITPAPELILLPLFRQTSPHLTDLHSPDFRPIHLPWLPANTIKKLPGK